MKLSHPSKPSFSRSPSVALAQVPRSNHVVLVVEENHSLSQVIGNPAMPYFNSLASTYAQATQFYANTHPSIGNYFMLTTGNLITNNDASKDTVTTDNIVRHLLTAGKTWKGYAENLPAVGYVGGRCISLCPSPLPGFLLF